MPVRIYRASDFSTGGPIRATVIDLTDFAVVGLERERAGGTMDYGRNDVELVSIELESLAGRSGDIYDRASRMLRDYAAMLLTDETRAKPTAPFLEPVVSEDHDQYQADEGRRQEHAD